MPQMSPLLWLFLMVIIITVNLFFMVINYFIMMQQVEETCALSGMSTVSLKDWSW